jgi:hypothetical protein
MTASRQAGSLDFAAPEAAGSEEEPHDQQRT